MSQIVELDRFLMDGHTCRIESLRIPTWSGEVIERHTLWIVEPDGTEREGNPHHVKSVADGRAKARSILAA